MEPVRGLLEYIDGLSARELVQKAVYLMAAAAAVVVVAASFMMRGILSDIPSIDKLDEYTPSLTTYVYDITTRS